MITYTDTTCTIKCDKCGYEETAPIESYNEQFHESDWIMSMSARKYYPQMLQLSHQEREEGTGVCKRKLSITKIETSQ